MIIALQVAAVLFGFTAAVLWWLASTLKIRTVKSLDGIVLKEGDLAMRVGEGEVLIWRVSMQNKLNAWGAIATGITVALQALTTAIQIQP